MGEGAVRACFALQIQQAECDAVARTTGQGDAVGVGTHSLPGGLQAGGGAVGFECNVLHRATAQAPAGVEIFPSGLGTHQQVTADILLGG